MRLAKRIARDGHEVICFRGEASLRPPEPGAPRHLLFSTNDDLLAKLSAVEGRERVVAVFHAAALADFRVEREGKERKLSSRTGALTLKLVPATKLLPQLRTLFPRAWVVGWKYEMDGDRESALARGRRQMEENGTDICVVNGHAYGPGFGLLGRDGSLVHLADRPALADALAKRLAERGGKEIGG